MNKQYAIRATAPATFGEKFLGYLRIEDHAVDIGAEHIFDAQVFPLREARRKMADLRRDPHRPPLRLELERAVLSKPKLELLS